MVNVKDVQKIVYIVMMEFVHFVKKNSLLIKKIILVNQFKLIIVIKQIKIKIAKNVKLIMNYKIINV